MTQKKTESSVQKQETSGLTLIKKALEDRKPELQKYLAAFKVDYNSFLTVMMENTQINPDLGQCSLASWIIAAKNAARTGFIPDGGFSPYAYLISRNINKGTVQNPKYEKEVKYQLGYLALKKMMQEDSSVSHVVAEIVHENDVFKVVKLPKPTLIHEPALDNPGERKGAYAAIFYHDRIDYPEFVYMNKEQIMDIASYSEPIKKAKREADKTNSEWSIPEWSPWHPKKDPNGWMWLKCPIRALAKKEDVGGDRLNQAMQMDLAVDIGYEEVDSKHGEGTVLVPIQGEQQEQREQATKQKSTESSNAVADKVSKEAEVPDDVQKQAEEFFASQDAQSK